MLESKLISLQWFLANVWDDGRMKNEVKYMAIGRHHLKVISRVDRKTVASQMVVFPNT